MPGKKLSADATLFYAAELVAAIVYLHSLNIVYRDLKPDNTLIGEDGHIKLVDFGLSVTNVKSSTDAHDTVGTPNYVSPEVLTAEIPGFTSGYGTSCDWWSLGVMLYEMLSGVTPFVEKHQLKLFWKILHQEVEWPSTTPISDDAKDLISGLLDRDPKVRYSNNLVKNHKYFSSIVWEDVLRKKLEPPYVPTTFHRASMASFSNLPTAISKMPAAETPEDNFLDEVVLAFENFTGAGKVDNFTFIAGEQTRKF
jgi:protein-serine/threonine kinase